MVRYGLSVDVCRMHLILCCFVHQLAFNVC